MDYLSNHPHNKGINNLTHLMTEYDKNNTSNTNLNIGKKEILLKNSNNYSLLKHNYGNGQLKNIAINFNFPNSRNTYKYKNAFPISKYPIYEQRNIFYYDKNFELFKNKSVSKYGEKKKINNASSPITRNNRLFSPQHKIMTSIKKKKLINTDERNNKQNEKDVYEIEVINTVLYDDEENIDKKEFVNEEWGEIEQEIEQKEKNKKNNLLNSVFVEIEKEDGDKQFKVVEISKDDKKPCIKVKYTIEDKICLNSLNDDAGRDDLISLYDKDTKDSVIRSPNYKTNTNSTYNNSNNNNNINYSINSLGRSDGSTNLRNTSNLLIDNKITQKLHSSGDNIYLSGIIPSIEKYQKFSNYKPQYEQQKERMKTGTYHKDNKYDFSADNRLLYKDHSEGILGKKERHSIKKEPRWEFNNSYFEIKDIKKHNKSGLKTPTPRNNKEEIQIDIESGLNSLRTPLKNISTHTPKISLIETNIDDITKGIREKYGDKKRKESIAEKELKIINIELKKPKYGNEKYSYLSSKISPKKTESQNYNKNNYFLTKQKSIDNLLKNKNNLIINKSQYLKETLKTEKPITTRDNMDKSRYDEIDSKRSFLKPNISESNNNTRKEESELILNRLKIYKSGGKEKKDNYLSEKKDGFMPIFKDKVNIEGISTKKEGYKKSLGETDSIVDKILAKKGLTKTKSEVKFAERHNTYQNKKKDYSIGSLGNIGNIGTIGNIGNIGSIGSIGSLGSIGSIESIGSLRSLGSIGILKEKEEKEKLEKEKERKEKERREREKLQIEKEMERMERERQKKERKKEKEREKEKEKENERLERENKEKERIEKMEKEKQEKERREREKQEQKEREKKEREQKEKERKEQKEKERLEREKEKERKKQESMNRFNMISPDSYQNKKEDIMGIKTTSGKKVIGENPSIRNHYKLFIENTPKRMNIGQIGQNNIRKIEISKDISSKGGSARSSVRGRDSNEKTFRYSSIGTDRKQEQNTESKIIRSRFDEEDGNDILSKINKTKGISLRNINELIENKLVSRSFKKPELESGNLFKKSYQLTEKTRKPENKYIKKIYQKDESNTIDNKLNKRTNIILPNQEIKIRDMKKIFQLPESKSIQLSEVKWTRSKYDIKTQEKDNNYLDLPNTKYSLNNIQKKDDSFNINKYLISDSKRTNESKNEIRKLQSRTADKYLIRESFSIKDIMEKEREKQEKREREIKEREEKTRIEREKKEKEKRERDEKAKIERERKEKEKKEKEERDRKEKERIEKEKIEKLEKEKKEREKKEREKQEKLEKEKKEKEKEREKLERERKEKLEKERREKEREKEKQERERKEKLEKERKEKEKEKEKKEREKIESERQEKLERERREKERERERIERDRQEKLERERKEKEREKEKQERERQEKLEKEKKEKEQK